MKISKVNIKRSGHLKNMVGFASIEFDNDLSLNSISIFRNPDGGYDINYPSEDILDPEHYWIFRPLSLKAHHTLESAILRELEK